MSQEVSGLAKQRVNSYSVGTLSLGILGGIWFLLLEL